jgi:hypothetical protein
LQKRQIGVVSEARNADDSQRAGLCRYDRQRNRPPWDVASSKELIAERALPFAEAQPEQGNPDQIDSDNREIETVQAHGLA